MNLRALSAIIAHTVRDTLRSGIAVATPAAVLLFTVGMPFVLHGGGDAFSRMHLAVLYPPVAAFSVMLCAVLWLACGLISREISGRQLQSVVVKPVGRASIWLGKWLGILPVCLIWSTALAGGMLLSASLLRSEIATDTAMLHKIDSRILCGREALLPEPVSDLRDQAEYELTRLVMQGALPPDTGIERVIGELKTARSMAVPGKPVSWTFSLPASSAGKLAENPVSLRFRFACNPMERNPVAGIWRIGLCRFSGENTGRWSFGGEDLVCSVSNLVDGIHVLDLPAGFQPRGERLTVTFVSGPPDGVSQGDPKVPTVYFDADRPVEIMVRCSGFSANVLRAAFVIFCFLAAVAAIGLMMGSMFSFPVALFSTSAIIFAVSLASSFSEKPAEHSHGGAGAAAGIVAFTRPLLLFVKHATGSITANLPFGNLASGMLYSAQQVCEVAFLLLLLVPAVCWGVSSLILKDKELAL